MAYNGKNPFKVPRALLLVGGVRSATLTGNETLTLLSSQYQRLDPGGANRTLTLPAEEGNNGLWYVFYNAADAAENLVINNDAAAAVATVNQGEWVKVACTGSAWAIVEGSGIGNQSLGDSVTFSLGDANDFSAVHNGTNTVLTSATGDLIVDNTAATGSTIMRLGTDTTAVSFEVQNNSEAILFSVTPSSASAGTALIAGVLDLNGTLDLDAALTGTGDAANITATISHATQVAEGLDVSIAQITNARTAGTVTGIKSSVTSLSGDTAGVDYYAFEAAVTVGEATADHFVLKQGAGFDKTIDSSACATTEAGWLVAANVASALTIGTSALTYLTLKTTTATPGLDESWALTGAEDAHSITTTVNLASGAVTGLHSSITTVTTNHTDGVVAAFKATVTSLAGDTGGDFVGLHIASTDGGGTTPIHSGIYCDDPLDALIKVAADGDGGFVVGAMTAKSPENDAEAGYFSIRIGATRYEVPFYAIA